MVDGKPVYSPKLNYILSYDLPNTKSVIYVKYKMVMQDLTAHIKRHFSEQKIIVLNIDGDIDIKKRKPIADTFNFQQKNVVLIIMKAGTEGVDLKGCRNIFFFDYPWTFSDYEQILGRGVRFKSHLHLPESERNVLIHNMFLVPDDNNKNVEFVSHWLHNIILKKKEITYKFNDVLMKLCNISSHKFQGFLS